MSVTGSILNDISHKSDSLVVGDGNILSQRVKPDKNNNRRSTKDRESDRELDLFDIISAPLPVSGEGDYLMIAAEVFDKALKSNLKVSDNKNYTIQPIPKEVGGLPYDVLVLIYQSVNGNMLLYPFVIADSMEREYTHPVFSSQTAKEYVVTPDSIYDMNVYNRIKRIVSKGHRSSIFNHVGFLLIPKGFDYENNIFVKRLLNNAMNAIDTIEKNKTVKAKHVSAVGLINRVRFAKDQVTTLHNRVVRSDLSITLEATKFKKNRRGHRDIATSDDFIDINRGIIRCDGFVDLVYAKPRGGFFGNNKVDTKYMPRLVLSNIEQRQRSNTLGLTLIAIATAYMLQYNRNWSLALKRPRGKAFVNEWHDIGAIAYEMDLAEEGEVHDFTKKVVTDDPTFDSAALKGLVDKSFINNLLVSLDVEMGGPQIWLQTHFTKAAYTENDHPNAIAAAKQANKYIIDVTNQITDGKFDELCGGREIDVVYSGYEKVHLGTYEDEYGELRDIRDICYRTILNNSNPNDLSQITAWANSFNPYSNTEGARLALREDMIRRMTSGRVNFEATAKRVTFNPAFLQIFSTALMSKGINIMPIISDNFNVDEDRYYANYAKYGGDIDPIKIMLIKQRGIDIDNPNNLTPQDFIFLKMLGINPFENQIEALMNSFGNRNRKYEYDKGYSCF